MAVAHLRPRVHARHAQGQSFLRTRRADERARQTVAQTVGGVFGNGDFQPPARRRSELEQRLTLLENGADARAQVADGDHTVERGPDAALFETALEPDESITQISFPVPLKAAYMKFPNPASRYALVGVFVAKKPSEIRVAITGAGASGVFRAPAFEEALRKRFAPKSLEGLSIPATGLNSDIHGGAEYRAHLVGVLARRAVAAAVG